MPPKAEVFVAEDDKDWQDIIKDVLKGAGHRVVLTASTRDEAIASAQRLQELGVKVATVDGNLNPRDADGADGKAVIEAIRKHAPGVKVVGLSGTGFVKGADVNVHKWDCSDKLGETVTKL